MGSDSGAMENLNGPRWLWNGVSPRSAQEREGRLAGLTPSRRAALLVAVLTTCCTLHRRA